MWIAALFACLPDDWNGEPYDPAQWAATGTAAATAPDPTDDTGAAPAGEAGLVGSWVSAGEDLSPLFAGPPFQYQRIEASFNEDGSYRVDSTDQGGAVYTLLGTYTVEVGAGGPQVVRLSQTDPYEAEAEGIWQVEGDRLTYEVVQVEPDYGFAPPTPEGGFGSTSGQGLAPGDNVQVYRR
jgi:hypothetical protein